VNSSVANANAPEPAPPPAPGSSDPAPAVGPREPAKLRGFGIAARTAVFSGLIATVTLFLFVVAILPQQKQTLEDNLRSKAVGVAVSLRDVTSSAVVNEDYSSVVDHCVEMIKGDPAIEFIVVTRNDGFSLVHDRTGWRSQPLDSEWHSNKRIATGSIREVPLFQRRVYAFSQPFEYSGIEWGWIHIGLSLDAYDHSIHTLYRRTALLTIACVLFGFLASVLYANFITRPIRALESMVQRVSSGDLSARAPAESPDELGRLARAFNTMTEALLRRDRYLMEANETLEQRVRERTRALEDQVAARERAHRQLAEAQHRLMQLSREAGMAEVATGVLHNVGNVLNSVNVSTILVRDTLLDSQLPQLSRTLTLLEQNRENLGRFLVEDPRGKHVLRFLQQLNTRLESERATLATEANGLLQNIEHIKGIVAMQQTFARAAAVIEQVQPSELIDHALTIQQSSLNRHNCRVHRFYGDTPALTTDRHKVVQILTNLVANAIHAVKTNPTTRREIEARVALTEDGRVALSIKDNGIGIAPENMPRIFSLGFTTRKDGHGFGLHAGALAARVLGGQIVAESSGVGAGATFTLYLPGPKRPSESVP